jgi:uncharacterized protein (TIGR02186 family)
MKWRVSFAAMIAPLLIGAAEPVLIPDVSQREVDIRYSFSGAELLLFGAILYPGGKAPTDQADIAVVLKGPPHSLVVREKQRFLGIWVNADSARFRSVPAFYSVASSRPISQILDARTAAIYELGLNYIQLSPGEAQEGLKRFETGLVDLRGRQALFSQHPGSVEIVQGALYRARLAIPARVPVGEYTAETFLIKDGRVLAAATRKISIRKSGFEKFVADSAKNEPMLYGLSAVLLSVALGWAAGAVFRKL